MKNILYDGNLEDDIYYLDNKFSFKKEFVFFTLIYILVAGVFDVVCIKLGIIPFNLESILISSGIELFCGTIINLTTTLKRLNTYKKNANNAKRNVFSLINELENNNISVTKERIVDSEMTEEVTKSVTSGDKGEVLSKKEIITKYFYLLDKDDKIKVLKQIEEYIKSNKKKTSSISLDLLEDDDLKKHELPVYKTLIKKKQD